MKYNSTPKPEKINWFGREQNFRIKSCFVFCISQRYCTIIYDCRYLWEFERWECHSYSQLTSSDQSTVGIPQTVVGGNSKSPHKTRNTAYLPVYGIMASDHDSDDVFVWCTSIDDVVSARTGDQSPWDFYLAETVSVSDKDRILTYMFDEDRKRSFLSILLQRASIRGHLQIDDDEQYSIERTPEVRFHRSCLSCS